MKNFFFGGVNFSPKYTNFFFSVSRRDTCGTRKVTGANFHTSKELKEETQDILGGGGSSLPPSVSGYSQPSTS